MPGIIAQLEIHAVAESPLGGIRRNEQRAHLGAIDQRPLITGDCVQGQVGSEFEPRGDPQRVLRYASERVLGDDATHEGRLPWAGRRQVVMQCYAEFAWFINLPGIDLNFVGLRIGRSQKKYAKDEYRPTGNPE